MLPGKHKFLKTEIERFQLQSAKSVKRLGITIDHNLTSYTHVSNICKTARGKVKSLSRIRNAKDGKQAKLLYNSFIFSQFNYCSIIWMFYSKASYKKSNKYKKDVYNELRRSLEELLIHDQVISVHRKHINTLLTEKF